MNTYPNTNRPPRKPANKRLIRAGVIAAVAIVLGIVAVFELPQGMFAWIAGKLRQIPACCRRNGR